MPTRMLVEYIDERGCSPFGVWFAQAGNENGERDMVLTRNFRETVAARVQSDVGFLRALLIEAIESLLAGDLATGKALLRDYINATLGFETLAEMLGKDSKSVHRMLGSKGNPRAENIFAIIKVLQDNDDVRLQVKISKSRAA